MSQNTRIAFDPLSYNRTDYTALRAFCLKVPLERIAATYYSEDSPQLTFGLERFLTSMRDALIERAIEHNPAFALSLKDARIKGISNKTLAILIEAADQRPAPAQPHDPLGQWLRPRTARALREAGVHSLGELVALINRRGKGWWRPIPRIGAAKAEVLLAWLRTQSQLGQIAELAEAARPGAQVMLDPAGLCRPRPLGTFVLPAWLDGSTGINRASSFCFLTARNDLQAIELYLARFDTQLHTQRAYARELERFLLWCALVARKPMSSVLVDDCEAYKRFLQSPCSSFQGRKVPRTSPQWRPFTATAMAPVSQRQAVTALRAAFSYLWKARYLGGNPWALVADPAVTQAVEPIQIERALSSEAWDAVVDVLATRGRVEGNAQDRAALAALLLMGDSGIRRSELAGAMRSKLAPSSHAEGVWMLTVLGKGNIERRVPISQRTIAALRMHSEDLGLDFDSRTPDRPLLSPVRLPPTQSARRRHRGAVPAGYTSNAIYDLVKAALRRVQRTLSAIPGNQGRPIVSLETIEALARASPHAFRHTFGTEAVERNMELDVVQDILGHASLSTTKIYARTRERRMALAAGRLFASREANGDRSPVAGHTAAGGADVEVGDTLTLPLKPGTPADLG